MSKDPERPFLVSAGEVTVRAVGTAFDVRLAPTAVEVLVTEGVIRRVNNFPEGTSRPVAGRSPANDGGYAARVATRSVTIFSARFALSPYSA